MDVVTVTVEYHVLRSGRDLTQPRTFHLNKFSCCSINNRLRQLCSLHVDSLHSDRAFDRCALTCTLSFKQFIRFPSSRTGKNIIGVLRILSGLGAFHQRWSGNIKNMQALFDQM